MFSRRSLLETRLAAAVQNPSDKTRKAFELELAKSNIVIGVREEAILKTDKEGRLLSPGSIEMLTSDGPDGKVLLCFTSDAELLKRQPNAKPLVAPLITIRQLIQAEQLTGVVINPNGIWLFLSREELFSVLERS